MASEKSEQRGEALRKRRAEHREKIQRRRARNQRFADKAAFHGIRWDYHSHEELYRWIHSAKPSVMGERASQWKDLGGKIKATTDEVQATVVGLRGSWRGSAADRAEQSNAALARWADQASETATQIGAGLERYTHAVEVAQHRMPPPAHPKNTLLTSYNTNGATQPNSAAMIMSLLEDHKADDDRAKAAKAEAVQVMRQYGAESEQVHASMPWFYDAPAAPAAAQPDPTAPKSADRPLPPDPHGNGPGQESARPLPQPNPNDSGTTASSFSPAGVSPGDHGPGSYGGQPGYGAGAGFPGSGGTDTVRGGSGIGAGPLAARSGAGAGAVPGLGGTRGPGGAGGAGGGFGAPLGGGAGAQGDEDGEHKNKFVEGLDRFDDLPPAYPPVFGA
jgi:uncharacterized protein YukE